MVKAIVVYGLGIGCHNEVAHAYEKAKADVEIVHIRKLLDKPELLEDSQILNFPGGFLHGDILGSGICAANEIEHSKLKDILLDYASKGNVIYGQCNGFQLLVKLGLLPGIDGDYSKQTVTLTHNDCGSYRVAPVLHQPNRYHFAFKGIGEEFYLWCRHGEGKIQFCSPTGSISKNEAERNRKNVNLAHTLMWYKHPETKEITEKFPHNPNGSIDGIAGLFNRGGNIFGHMAHTEVSVYASRNPTWFAEKDKLRRKGLAAAAWRDERLEDIGLKVYRNIVKRCK